ncbi:hypothetical protein JN11_04849 [Mucilaginibacter frigoritolerans]|uniref:Uncharacterized protein n=1 Tax=Mucilaginibacter frigoritolerans TaxID=652788 RepID=A0A562TKM8_9SPHI|nr:hypothetical protein [Mucilaginibacter frigoritolerans]TWI94032.1 hypothetical protein JN11_04849 [Mucilaginibacter frigoritolerans]
MGNKRFTYLLFSAAILIMAVVSSCQKDDTATPPDSKTTVNADSSLMASPGNFLAASGTLEVKFNDSTYTFDAAHDSIAFINVHVDSKTNYFGITAINKNHSMSFGISSLGYANSNINSNVAGGQFLLSTDAQKPAMQLSLSKYAQNSDIGSISLDSYNQGSQLAKGTFITFLAKDDKANSPYFRVEGSFDLKLK